MERVLLWLSEVVFCFQAEDGIRDLVRSRGLGDVYKRQEYDNLGDNAEASRLARESRQMAGKIGYRLIEGAAVSYTHLTLPTSDLV